MPDSHGTFQRGSQGPQVQELQQKLKAAGFDPGGVDGVFGPATAAAVSSFQRAHGLTADGIVGPQTWAALDAAVAHGGESGPVLRRGAQGAAVRELQQRLAQLGFNVGAADGVFGPNTEAGVRAFQQARGLLVDGVVGAQTWAALAVDHPVIITTGRSPIAVSQVQYGRYTGGGGLNAWIAAACAAAGVPYTQSWQRGYETLCMRESSGNANAINTSDSNARGAIVADGHPSGCSRGVAQCIPPTFANNHAAGTSNAIYDPVANIAASILYVMSRYHVSPDGSDLARKVQQADPNRPHHGY